MSTPVSTAPAAENRIDLLFLQVVWKRLVATMDAAAGTMRRTAVSTLVRECNDFGLVLTDARGRSVAEPGGALPGPENMVQYALEHVDTFLPGDVYICNDAWEGTGHIHDICLVAPIFVGDRLVGFAAGSAHSPDIGGRFIGMHNQSVFEEGLQIPLSRLYAAGEPNRLVFDFLRRNVRFPRELEGDLEAQMAACRFIAQRSLELLEEYGLDDLAEIADAIIEQTRTAMRGALAALPDGAWEAEYVVDGLEAMPVIRVAARKRGETISLDFTGTTAQQPWACNLPIKVTRTQCAEAMKTFLLPDLPQNHGIHVGVEVTAPAGTIVSAEYPAATGMRHVVSHGLPTLLARIVAQIDSSLVRADPGSPGWVVHCTGIGRDGKPFSDDFLQSGGFGAGKGVEGTPPMCFPVTAQNAPVEMLESRFPLRFLQRSLREHSGGRGAWHGGPGQVIEFEVEGVDPLECAISPTHTVSPALGLEGGEPGSLGRVLLNGEELGLSELTLTLHPGDMVRLELPGGGGFGDPADRNLEHTEASSRKGLK